VDAYHEVIGCPTPGCGFQAGHMDRHPCGQPADIDAALSNAAIAETPAVRETGGRADIGCGDHVRWRPTIESPWGGMIIEGIAERVCERADGTRRLTVLRVTAVHRGTSLGERGFALGSLVDVTVAPGTVVVLHRGAASRAAAVHDLAQQGHITSEQARGLMKAPQMLEPVGRPDGFDQRQVDAARAALLAPAPRRYPRTR
jgi:hypothetical protein